MKITSEHIGKKVRAINTYGQLIVEFVGADLWIGESGTKWMTEGYWELVEEPKKPSERIKELQSKRGTNFLDWIGAVEDLLDEQAEKSK